MRRVCRLCMILLSLAAGVSAASPVVPHVYRSGVNLGSEGGTVSRAVTYWKRVVYVSVDAETCWIGMPQSCATVYAVDVSDPGNLHYVSKSDEGGCKANGLTVWEDKLYVAKWFEFLTAWDISSPATFSYLGQYKIPSESTWSISASGDRVYLGEATETQQAFYIMDVSDPRNPVQISRSEWMGSPAVRGSYSFYTDGTYIKVLNISDEGHPWPMAAVNIGEQVGEIVLRDRYAYVKFGWPPAPETGMVILDVSDPRQPVEIGRWTSVDSYGFRGIFLLGDMAFLPTSGNGFFTVDISDPTQPRTLAQCEVPYYSLELAITGNGPYLYVGTAESAAGVHCFQVLSEDPDNAGPGRWSGCSLGEASWDVQYEGDVLPAASSPDWTLIDGSETFATNSQGVLRINDNSSLSGSKVKWARSWDATNSRGTTVLARAKCASYSPGGSPLSFFANIGLRDGTCAEEFSLLSDRILACRANRSYFMDATDWHTYRITTQGTQFQVYVDEDPVPVLVGPLTANAQQDFDARWTRIVLGSGSSFGQQDISFDYVYCFANGAVPPPARVASQRPNISVKVADVEGKGSLSGLNPATARVMWSVNGGATWEGSGGPVWQCRYQGSQLPSASSPIWSVSEGSESWASVADGVLRVNDTSIASGSKIKWQRDWNAVPATGATVLARARCASVGGDTSLLGNIYIEDGVHEEYFRITPGGVMAVNAGLSYALDGTQWHVYRFTILDSHFQVFVDEGASAVLSGPLVTGSSNNRVRFGSGASAATQDIYFDYVRYSTDGVLPPGQGDDGGAAAVTFTPVSAVTPTDRGTITAFGVPLDHNSDTLNKVRFSIQDLAGNVGYSPVYNVRNGKRPDFDGDRDVDQEDFGRLQACLGGDGQIVPAECLDADLDWDDDVDGNDVLQFSLCVGGPGGVPGC